MMAEPAWRPMRAHDINGLVSVAAQAFPDHFEKRECFEERLTLFPQGCFVLASTDSVRGYMVAYPWTYGTIPPLNRLLGILPQSREALYLHDLALHTDVQGQGHSRTIIERLVAAAHLWKTRTISLVSVNDSVPFWRSMGFSSLDDDPAIPPKLHDYGSHSTYMVRTL